MLKIYKLLFLLELLITIVLCALGLYFRIRDGSSASQPYFISAIVSSLLLLVNYATYDFVKRKLG